MGSDQSGLTGRTTESGGHFHNGSWFTDGECHCSLSSLPYAGNTPEYRVWKIARDNGKAAASWVFDGNTPRETYAAVLRGIENDDPEVMDAYRTPDFSGEYADDYSEDDLMRDADWVPNDGTDLRDALTSQYLQEVSDAFWGEIERTARANLA